MTRKRPVRPLIWAHCAPTPAPRRPASPAAVAGGPPAAPDPRLSGFGVAGDGAEKNAGDGAEKNAGIGAAPLGGRSHPLADQAANDRLAAYERGVRNAFDRIEPVLRRVAASTQNEDFPELAQDIVGPTLGFALPRTVLDRAWIDGLDLRALYAWSVFETFRAMSDRFFTEDPLGGRKDPAFAQFIHRCGFHTVDISPCADGRLAHVVSQVLRLPFGEVRRRAHAGALFDIEDSVAKWVEVEMLRHREGVPTPADQPTRYLKVAVYHTSSSDPDHEGCAAHGSDVAAAAQAGLDRLYGFRQAIANGFCCGANIDLLLVGLDTDTDAIRLHLPDRHGTIDPSQALEAREFWAETVTATGGPATAENLAEAWIRDRLGRQGRTAEDGMVRFAARLLAGNLSQIDWTLRRPGGRHADVGHAERFMGLGIGFEEIQLRNLTYFAYLHTVEEGAADLDVGVKIFKGLNVARGLPVPAVIRFDYHGTIPGARDRAVERGRRVERALLDRFAGLAAEGRLHTVVMVRDCAAGARVEVVGGTIHDAEGETGR